MKSMKICKIQVMHTFEELLLSTVFAPTDFLPLNKNFRASQDLIDNSFSKVITQAIYSSVSFFSDQDSEAVEERLDQSLFSFIEQSTTVFLGKNSKNIFLFVVPSCLPK